MPTYPPPMPDDNGSTITKAPRGKKPSKVQHPYITALAAFLSSHPSDQPPPAVPRKLRYDLYGDLLLLPPTSPLVTAPWSHYITSLPASTRVEFYSTLASAFNTTHIAINAPIPTSTTDDDSDGDSSNRIRAPRITCLHGEFGDISSSEYTATFWAHTTQHGITQTWAPLHTMFSRGNITEKARIYTLVSSQLQDRERCTSIAAVDLFVGVGYFAFSYLRAGVDVVYGWDINRWSVEGCRRGAVANKWPVTVLTSEEECGKNDVEGKRLVVHQESNAYAPRRLADLKRGVLEGGGQWPQIMHVNLGLLPSSAQAYEIAVEVLRLNDTDGVSWVHVHENTTEGDADKLAGDVVGRFRELVGHAGVECEHIEYVKSWAPGVWHCVFDVRIEPIRQG
ncbi:hypothetical protein DRE_02781 [Drechslerella stenobrocha 248]|uniref:tRNA wybutosine-synthesizing protein 2 n=1 Tax=Drechslerella stenobrocha 248 TaxID=1043628 RepID=W7HWH4_9PEZI|nr:hypothetical protein DRE_02781 [Drechslerella stenobrocha 248]